MKGWIWLPFSISLLASGSSLDELMQFAGRSHRMIKLGLNTHNCLSGLVANRLRQRWGLGKRTREGSGYGSTYSAPCL